MTRDELISELMADIRVLEADVERLTAAKFKSDGDVIDTHRRYSEALTRIEELEARLEVHGDQPALADALGRLNKIRDIAARRTPRD